MPIRSGMYVALASLLLSNPASAQGWSFDARKIGLGGLGSDNLATEMVEQEQAYRTIVLPFGLVQVFGELDIYKPSSDRFNLVQAIEYAASPLHYVIGRGSTAAGETFETDLGNATLSRDLNQYRGINLPNTVRAEEFVSPTWGVTKKFREGAAGTFHGIRFGAGPYLSMQNIGTIDKKLTDLLASDTDVVLPNTQFLVTNDSQGQIALAVTGGYRGRLAWPRGIGGGSVREGLYVAADYHYLHGFRYEEADLNLRIDTDATGLIAVLPAKAPLTVKHLTATTGRGMAVDLGVTAVVNRWELGFGATGLANRITWTSVDQTSFTLRDLVSGDGDFLESPKTRAANIRVKLPTGYRGIVEYNAQAWSALGEVGHGVRGTSFHIGVERRYRRFDLRGGTRLSRDRWIPTGGIGFTISPRISLDVAVFGTTAVIERKRQLAIAASIRLNRAR